MKATKKIRVDWYRITWQDMYEYEKAAHEKTKLRVAELEKRLNELREKVKPWPTPPSH